MNVGIYNRIRGSTVFFDSSTFLLVHKVSLKYLTLVEGERDNVVLELSDFPQEKSFFKFAPTMKIQQ